jgi:hypothetical protein
MDPIAKQPELSPPVDGPLRRRLLMGFGMVDHGARSIAG